MMALLMLAPVFLVPHHRHTCPFENAQSIGTGFCKMLPGAVSAIVLQAPDNEDVDN
jgi:hypothetical protein